MAYTTVANVEAYMRTSFDGTTSPADTTVSGWVSDVDAEIDNLLGVSFSSQTATQYWDVGTATNKFLVDNYPLISITSVEYNNGTEFSENWVAFNNYRKSGDFIITDKTIGPYKDVAVKAVYEWGYTSVPPEVSHLATLLVVKKIVNSDDVANSGTESLSIGSLSITSNIGMSRLVNLDRDIDNIVKRIGKKRSLIKRVI